MSRTSLKQRRQELNLTQVEVARAVGVSQPTYQNYEAGTITIPDANLKRLMKVLKMTREEILGRPKNKSDDLKSRELPDEYYWGEIAIHFTKGPALVLSISYGECKRLFRQLQGDGKFFHVFSLSNQMVAVRRAAVTDVYLADDGSSTFGPEHDSYDAVGPWRPSTIRFWKIAEDLVGEVDSIEELEAKYGKDAVTEVARSIGLNMPEDIDRLIEEGKVGAKDRDSVLAEAEQTLETAKRIALDVTWQLSVGKVRRASSWDCELTRYWWIQDECDPEAQGPMIIVETEDAQTAFINPDELDYISIPEHRFRAAEEEEMTEDEEATKAPKKQKRQG
jgi:transcriptional regulator with XRE-family HTH domain